MSWLKGSLRGLVPSDAWRTHVKAYLDQRTRVGKLRQKILNAVDGGTCTLSDADRELLDAAESWAGKPHPSIDEVVAANTKGPDGRSVSSRNLAFGTGVVIVAIGLAILDAPRQLLMGGG
jgi:hypothetical protein